MIVNLAWGYAMLMSPNKDETAVHGCHCQGDLAVRMRKVLQTAGLVFECVTCFFRVSSRTLRYGFVEALHSVKNDIPLLACVASVKKRSRGEGRREGGNACGQTLRF